MNAVASLRKVSTLDAVKVVDKVIVGCDQLSGLLDMYALWVTLTKLTLVKAGTHNSGMLDDPWPRIN